MPKTNLPAQYSWLAATAVPKILQEALKLYGTKEILGSKHNPVIIGWAKEIGDWVGTYYKTDETPWCGLFVGICAKRAGFPFNQKVLSARSWNQWDNPAKIPMLGDVLIFSRDGGGHVGFYVGEDAECFHVLGGNQNNQVSITRIQKNRLLSARRCAWKNKQPISVRQVNIKPDGAVSINEK